jgi:phosphate transport system substrate-binding protein
VRIPIGLAVAAALVLTGCGSSGGKVRIDGSSTVYLLTAVAAEDFQLAQPGIPVTVGSSGTGGGFARFCRGEIDANNASRAIKEIEAEDCARNGIEYAQLSVAVDALTVVVNKTNDWATCLTLEQLAAMWAPGSTVNNWNQVDPSFPDVPLRLFGPGTDSGTFDYFTDVVNGEEGASRTDFTPSEDDNVTVQGVVGSRGGLGYFGFTYYEENADQLRAVEIDSGDGCVAPSAATAQNGTYTPMARPLFVYPSVQALARPEVRDFFTYYVDNDASIAEGADYIPLNEEQSAQLISDFEVLLAKAAALPVVTE